MTITSEQEQKFQSLVTTHELNPAVAEQLKFVLSTCHIVVLCDDSSSMSKPIQEEGTDPFAPKRSTRWLELKKLVSTLIEFVTCLNSNGMDLYFLNRPGSLNVTNMNGLQNIFQNPPQGGTPLCAALANIFRTTNNSPAQSVLVIVISDGEPTDGTRQDLYNVLCNKSNKTHISFAECTDNAEDMEYLDAWDGQIKNFDNTDDYREELQRVKLAQGQQFKFDFTDYVIKILLATYVRWYFNLDRTKVTPQQNQPQYNANQPYQPPIQVQPMQAQPVYQQQPQYQSQQQPMQAQPVQQQQQQPYMQPQQGYNQQPQQGYQQQPQQQQQTYQQPQYSQAQRNAIANQNPYGNQQPSSCCIIM